MRSTSIDISGRSLRQHKSLPGQQQLFAVSEGGSTPVVGPGAAWCSQLFETGRDLPGAEEIDQVIIWDAE